MTDEPVTIAADREARHDWAAERPDPERPDDDGYPYGTYPGCGRGRCYHATAGIPCPPDPWEGT